MDNNNGDDNSRQWSKNSEDILQNRYPMHKSCREGDIESLSLLLVSGQHNPLLEDEFYGWTPAHWAAYFGKLACLRKMMQCLNREPLTSKYQQSPTHLSAYSGHPHCLEWLLSGGSDINKQDYLGEAAVHKAARTGSMECVSLLAARDADLNQLTVTGASPYEVAAQCGYPDCSLYLKRAAEQQVLKSKGMIADTVLPVVHSQSVLPGQKPDISFITQGLNGGRLPSSIDSHCITKPDLSMDMDMDCVSSVGANHNGAGDQLSHGFHNGNHNGLNSHTNGFTPHTNGFTPHTNGFATHTNGFSHMVNGISQHVGVQKDVLMSQDVSANRVPVAGRKRGREVLHDELDCKRGRMVAAEMPAVPIMRSQPCSVQHQSSSADEHFGRILAQQGYDSLMYENMLREYHGA